MRRVLRRPAVHFYSRKSLRVTLRATAIQRRRLKQKCQKLRRKHGIPGILRSGEGGIRTPERLAPLLVFETRPVIPQGTDAQQVTETVEAVLPPCLPSKVEIDTDLARMIEVWPRLPEALRRGILAMVGSTLPATEHERATSGESKDG